MSSTVTPYARIVRLGMPTGVTINEVYRTMHARHVRYSQVSPKPIVRQMAWDSRSREIAAIIVSTLDDDQLLAEVSDSDDSPSIEGAALSDNLPRVMSPWAYLLNVVGSHTSALDLEVDDAGNIAADSVRHVLLRVASVCALLGRRSPDRPPRPVWLVCHPHTIHKTLGDLSIGHLALALGAEVQIDPGAPEDAFALALGHSLAGLEVLSALWFRFPTEANIPGTLSQSERDALEALEDQESSDEA